MSANKTSNKFGVFSSNFSGIGDKLLKQSKVFGEKENEFDFKMMEAMNKETLQKPVLTTNSSISNLDAHSNSENMMFEE